LIFGNRHQTFILRNDDYCKGSIKTPDLIEALIDDPSKVKVRQSKRHIIIINRQIRGRNWWAEGAELEISSVIRLLEILSNLKFFTYKWANEVPLALLNVLEKFHSRVHSHSGSAPNMTTIKKKKLAELALALSLNLRYIGAKFWSTGNTQIDSDMRFAAFKRIIALSPHLEHVKIL